MSFDHAHLRGSCDKETRIRVPPFPNARTVELIDPSRGCRAGSLEVPCLSEHVCRQIWWRSEANLRAGVSELRSRVLAVADFAHQYIFSLNNIHFEPQLSPTAGLVRATM